MTSDLLETIEIETAPSPRASIIWLHGLGADGHDFVPIVPELELPKTLAVVGKGEKPRIVGIPPQLIDVLKEWIRTATDQHPSTYVFGASRSPHMTPHVANDIARRWGREAGVAKCTPQCWVAQTYGRHWISVCYVGTLVP